MRLTSQHQSVIINQTCRRFQLSVILKVICCIHYFEANLVDILCKRSLRTIFEEELSYVKNIFKG